MDNTCSTAPAAVGIAKIGGLPDAPPPRAVARNHPLTDSHRLRDFDAPMLPSLRCFLCFLCVAVLLGHATASAAERSPLGATPQQIIERYGPVLAHHARVHHHLVITGGSAMDGDLHGKDGLVIRVVYQQNRAVLLEFVRAAGNLTPAEITALLATCDEGSTWEMGKDSTNAAKLYHRADGKAIAHWAVEDGSLLVASEGDKANSDLMDRLMQ